MPGGTIVAMPDAATKEQLRAWLDGQQAANERHRGDVASMTPDEKLRQISRLMRSAGLFDMSRRAAGDRAVIELWQRLRARWPNRE
jgi:hypothetical protein